MIAHRGASRAERENSVAAFETAVAMGADGIELDVRRTRDGRLAVHHDARTSSGRLIVEHDLVDLLDEVITLEAALAGCGDLEINVEIKNNLGDPDHDPVAAIVGPVIETLDGFGHPDRILVSSFDLNTIDRVRSESGYATAYLVHRGDPTKLIQACARGGHRTIHPDDLLVDEVFVAQARHHDLAINVWTVDDPARMRQLAALGVDGIVTNVPDVARALFPR